MGRIRRCWLLGGASVLAASIVGTAANAGGSGAKLTLVAYSTPKDAYTQIIPAFQKTAAGKGVSFTQSYGPSGEQSRAVKNGLSADVVAFSLEPDITRLVNAGLVAKTWKQDRYKGIVTDSVVVIVTRPGNPKHIKGWNDLLKPGIQVVTPNPFTSGGARWNVMAAYGAQRQAGKTHKQAVAFLTKLFKNVVVQNNSAREALQTFASGKGDVLISYENEAIYAKRKGVSLYYKIPRSTILIENPIAVVKTSKAPAAAKAFVKFLRGTTAQGIFGQAGYRPVVKTVARKFHFPKPPQLFTIDSFGMGGWRVVQKRFFDPHTGIMVKVGRTAGG
jgi:sulfate/thiosulfate-binding protein